MLFVFLIVVKGQLKKKENPKTSATLGTEDEDKQNKKQNIKTEQHGFHINCR
jgi:hypothetical protein